MKRPKPLTARNLMLISAGLLLLLGTMAVFTASSFKSLLITESESSTYFLFSHVKKVVIAMVAGLLAWAVPFHRIKKAAPFLYGASLALLILLQVLKGSHWAPVINGSARWLVLPAGFRLMPSELVRFSYVLLAASMVSGGVIRARTGRGVTKLSLLAIVPAGLIAVQPDFAGGMYMLLVMVVVLFLAESRFRDIMVLLMVLLAFASLVIFTSEYRRQRLISWFSPEQAEEAALYQPEQACIALGSGGVMGRGIGRGRQQRGFLPEAFSDYILAVIGEESGFIGVLMILSLLFMMLMCGWFVADGADHLFGYLVAGGLVTSIALGMFIHVAVVTRIFPTTGMPLPLVSWGGSNLLITSVSLGLIARIAGEGARA